MFDLYTKVSQTVSLGMFDLHTKVSQTVCLGMFDLRTKVSQTVCLIMFQDLCCPKIEALAREKSGQLP